MIRLFIFISPFFLTFEAPARGHPHPGASQLHNKKKHIAIKKIAEPIKPKCHGTSPPTGGGICTKKNILGECCVWQANSLAKKAAAGAMAYHAQICQKQLDKCTNALKAIARSVGAVDPGICPVKESAGSTGRR